MESNEATNIESLSDNINDLAAALKPFLLNDISVSTGKLPLLDNAKTHVLFAYAIESILFSYLRLNGHDARGHAVFHELTRVKQYFEKMKAAEVVPDQQSMRLDKNAAQRFITNSISKTPTSDGSSRQNPKRKLEDAA